jgi:hypothetical protein
MALDMAMPAAYPGLPERTPQGRQFGKRASSNHIVGGLIAFVKRFPPPIRRLP